MLPHRRTTPSRLCLPVTGSRRSARIRVPRGLTDCAAASAKSIDTGHDANLHLRHHVARRQPGRGGQLLAPGQAADHQPARRAGVRLYRRGLSAFQPQGRRLFPRSPRPGAEAREGRGLRHDSPARHRRRGRSGHEGAGRGADAGDHDRRQELGPARPRRAGRLARGEPADDRRLGRFLRRPRVRGDLRRRAFLRRLQAEP